VSEFISIFTLTCYLLLTVLIARRARQRGYSRWYWFVAALCLNAPAVLALLGALPNRAQDDRRKQEADWLAQRLLTATLPPPAAIPSLLRPAKDATVGDHETA